MILITMLRIVIIISFDSFYHNENYKGFIGMDR